MTILAMIALLGLSAAQDDNVASDISISSADGVAQACASVMLQRDNRINLAPDAGSKGNDKSKSSGTGVVVSDGASAGLDAVGYEQLVAGKDKEQMELYILRLAGALGLRVVNETELAPLGSKHLDAKKPSNFSNLVGDILLAVEEHKGVEVLKGTPNGDGVPLNKYGYQDVLKWQSNNEMGRFISRVAEASGINITDPGYIQGIAAYYSGEKGIQSFARLTEELEQYAKKASSSKNATKGEPKKVKKEIP